MLLHFLFGFLLFGFTLGDDQQIRRNSLDYRGYFKNGELDSGDGVEEGIPLIDENFTESNEGFQTPPIVRRRRDEDCHPPPDVIRPMDDMSSSTLWEILGKTEKELEIYNGDAVLLLGNTGSGKSTVVLTITGDLKNLTVFETKGGSLIIVDVAQKIGITTSSRTLVPDMIHDPPNNLNFYDCPGFLDNRDYKADITANYLMKKATEKLTSVRTVFVVPEDSVTMGGIKTDFGTLANSAIRVIKDLAKLQPGIGMIVTKVNSFNTRGKVRNDSLVLNGVTQFLEQYKKDEQKKLIQLKSGMNDESNTFVPRQKLNSPWRLFQSRPNEEQEAIRRRIQFVDILLQKDRISIFRSPDECGSFDKSTWSQESKDWMTKLIRDDLKSVPVQASDFGYAVSSDTTLKVVDLYKELNLNVTDLVYNLVKAIKVTQLELTLTMKDFFQVKAWLDADYSNFTRAVQELKSSKSPKEFGRKIYEVIVARGYEQKWGLDFIAEAEKIESYMDFFDLIAPMGVTYDRKAAEWLEPLQTWLSEEVSGRKEWYDFMDKLRNVFSYFRFQTIKQSSVPKNITEIKASLGKDGDIVTENVIKLYNKSVGGGSMSILTPEDIKILWEIVNEAFEVPQIECSSSKMTVKGSFVKVSDFTEKDGSFVLCGGSPPSQVVVYATRKVFFDRSVNAQKSLNSNKELGIVSPEWEVIEQVILDLSGQKGPSGGSRRKRQVRSGTYQFHPSNSSGWTSSESAAPVLRSPSLGISKNDLPSYIRDACANSIVQDGSRGSTGSPGKHGGPGGNVIGLVGHIENGDRLKVTVQGGTGGEGQAGRSGEEGQKGVEYKYREWQSCDASGPCDSKCPKGGFRQTCNTGGTSWPSKFDSCFRKESGVIDCVAYGCVGGKGGPGGDGGAGGKGGIGGQGIIVTADGSKVSINSEGGLNGRDGIGGYGGLGGYRGDGASAGIHRSTVFDCPCWWEDVVYDLKTSQRSESGVNGVTGANKYGQGTLHDPSFQLTQADLFLSYEEFALSRDSLYFPNQKFLDLIGNSQQVTQNFTHIHFAQELLILERANLLLKNKKVSRDSITLMMTPKYQSFISRVDGYVKSKSLDDLQKMFLSLLYSTALNQKRTLQQAFGAPLVIDVAGYLETVGLRLEGYSKTETKVVVEAERVRYTETFTQKMKDAMEFIMETVNPAVEKAFFEMDGVTRELAVCIEKMVAEAEAEEAAYKKAVKQAKKKMKLRILFNAVEVGVAVISIVGGPEAAVVGSIIGGAAAIGQSFALAGGSELRPPTPLDPRIKKYADLMEAKAKVTSQERQDELNTLIEETRTAVMENKELLFKMPSQGETRMAVTENNEILLKMSGLVETLEVDKKNLLEKGPSSSLKEFQDLNKKVLESEKSLVDSHKETTEFITKAQKGEIGTAVEQKNAKIFGNKTISSIKKIGAAVKVVATLGYKIYNDYKNDESKIQRLMKMIEEAEEQIKELNSYKKSIDSILVPFTDSVINDLDKAQKQMEGKNAVFLRVQQWQVQNVLRKYNFFLQDFSGAFPEVAGQYRSLVEDLQEAMTLMIDLYSFIDQYNEQMQFADYIANINSPRGLAAKFGPVESAIFDKVNLALQASLILNDWDTCIQTFQQWVFPFSTEFQQYLLTSDIPDYLAPTTPAEIFKDVLPNIRQRVSNLMIAIKQYKTAVFPMIDNQLHLTPFNSELTSMCPFHVWRQKLNEKKIRDLLAGKQVTLSISPEFTYERDMSAVKFTIAEIEPKAQNETIQQNLKEVLKKLKIQMTHSGVSKYLYKGAHFQMVGAKQEISFNFERNGDGQRIAPNQVYQKIKTGDVILSPYTLWTVQISKAYSSIEFDFSELEKFSGFVDVELIGNGSFVRKKMTRSNVAAVPTPLPLHYFRFKLSTLPSLGDQSRLQNLLLRI